MYTWWALLGSFMGSYYFFGDLGLLVLWAAGSLLAFSVRTHRLDSPH